MTPDDLNLLDKIEAFLRILPGCRRTLDVWEAQNLCFSLRQQRYSEMRQRTAGKGEGSKWMDDFNSIAAIPGRQTYKLTIMSMGGAGVKTARQRDIAPYYIASVDVRYRRAWTVGVQFARFPLAGKAELLADTAANPQGRANCNSPYSSFSAFGSIHCS